MDSVSLSLEVLGGLLGKTTVELQSALMIDGNDGKKIPVDQSNIDKYVTDALRSRLADQKTTGKDEHVSYGKKAAYDDVEKFLIENHGIAKGTDWKTGIAAVVTEAKAKAQTSDEAVKTSDAYKAMVEKAQQAESDLQTTKKQFRERIIDENLQRQLESALSDSTLALALPDDQSIRANQLTSFKAFLASKAKLDMTEAGDIIPVGNDGKQLEDANYLPLSLKSLIVNNAKSFWPAKSGESNRQPPPAGDPSGKGPGDPGAGGNKFPAWKSAEEFSSFTDKAILDGKDVAYLKEATAAFESQNT